MATHLAIWLGPMQEVIAEVADLLPGFGLFRRASREPG